MCLHNGISCSAERMPSVCWDSFLLYEIFTSRGRLTSWLQLSRRHLTGTILRGNIAMVLLVRWICLAWYNILENKGEVSICIKESIWRPLSENGHYRNVSRSCNMLPCYYMGMKLGAASAVCRWALPQTTFSMQLVWTTFTARALWLCLRPYTKRRAPQTKWTFYGDRTLLGPWTRRVVWLEFDRLLVNFVVTVSILETNNHGSLWMCTSCLARITRSFI